MIKNILESANIAFSMYSIIPMLRIDWNSQNMKYALCYLPCIGLVIGALQGVMLWGLSQYTELNSILLAAFAVLLPVLITGGIHMDGFCDTMDAIGSHQTIEKKLEILKDSNSGAFAVIGCASYFIMSFAAWYSAIDLCGTAAFWTLMLTFTLSRSLSGLAIVSFKCAKNSGLVSMFAKAADRKKARIVLAIWVVLTSCAMLLISVKTGVLCILTAALVFGCYYRMCMKQFGGVTGDLAGFFLQNCELLMCLAAAIGGI